MNIEKLASQLSWKIPFAQKYFSKKSAQNYSLEDLKGFFESEQLALQAVQHIGSLLQPGWSELKTSQLLETYLRDHGVKHFFHRAFVWFGERTKFQGIHHYKSYAPSHRILQDGEVYILDVAPIYKNYTCDVGFTGCIGSNKKFEASKKTLNTFYKKIPQLFLSLIHI